VSYFPVPRANVDFFHIEAPVAANLEARDFTSFEQATDHGMTDAEIMGDFIHRQQGRQSGVAGTSLS